MNSLKHILYVEDEPHIAEITKMTLEDLGGFSVVHCACGTTALETFAEMSPKPDLILLDVMLPGCSGVEVLDEMRKTIGGNQTPVIFLTAKAQKHEQQEYLRKGAIGVIIKPYDATHLCQTITRLWKNYEQKRSRSVSAPPLI